MYKLMIKKYKKLSSKVTNKFVDELKNAFKSFDKKTIKILKYGLIFCFLITILSVIILVTYLFFVHSQIIYNIGILVFQISLYYAVFFIASAFTVDTIKNMI